MGEAQRMSKPAIWLPGSFSGVASIPDSMRQCYEALVASELVPRTEMALLDCWLTDLGTLEPRPLASSS